MHKYSSETAHVFFKTRAVFLKTGAVFAKTRIVITEYSESFTK